ncbi:hypothetical protein ULMS_20770 [Patiriisocius marinistellae]|uniref:ZIP family metal transporter n=1 Tax=Patiriisocius marinistellae TaxID=2494560 RepID=A0A5J4G1L3_9FLAO|nr:ZIP family metal transporter [Patiriisocius marinistellae]GEQ86569.1 hypothetical protein ULMS_20770 [Patiriisocius marinistellae]
MIYIALFIAVIAGYGVSLILNKGQVSKLPLLLAFSGAFLLALTLFELLPEVYETPSKKIGVFIMAGILLQICLEFFSKGAEHGHVHLHGIEKTFPWLLFISLSIHALLEGFPIADGHSIYIGVLIHKFPIAIILSLFFIKAKYSKSITLAFLLLFALMTPLGAFIAENTFELKKYSIQINAVVIGIFLHVSTTILFESSKDHKFNFTKLATIILGVLIAYFI